METSHHEVEFIGGPLDGAVHIMLRMTKRCVHMTDHQIHVYVSSIDGTMIHAQQYDQNDDTAMLCYKDEARVL